MIQSIVHCLMSMQDYWSKNSYEKKHVFHQNWRIKTFMFFCDSPVGLNDKKKIIFLNLKKVAKLIKVKNGKKWKEDQS